jgi:hypothetical protein
VSKVLYLLPGFLCFSAGGMEISDGKSSEEQHISLSLAHISDNSSALVGVCRENEPFYDQKNYVKEMSMFSMIAIPVNDGSQTVYRKENLVDATVRLRTLTEKLIKIQLKQPTIPLENKITVCNAITESITRVLNTYYYWANLGYANLHYPWYRDIGLAMMNEYVLKIREDLINSNDGCIPDRILPKGLQDLMYTDRWSFDECDVVKEEPEGVFPYDVPRYLPRKDCYPRVNMETVFFRLVSATNEIQKVNIVEGAKILDDWTNDFINIKLNNQSIPLNEKISICDSIIKSCKNIRNAMRYWMNNGVGPGWDAAIPIFGDPSAKAYHLRKRISKIREELLKNDRT